MNAQELDKWREAGRIAARCREWARSTVAPGVRLRDVLEGIESRIRDAGAIPAFPAQTSRNHVAAHYCTAPDEETVYAEGDLVKVDLGVCLDGAMADTACTIDLSADGRWASLVQASADALAAAIALVEPGRPTNEIGAAVERVIQAAGFEPVRNLTGHGLGRWQVHTAPQIPSCPDGSRERLRAGQVVAIEPFACTGRGHTVERGRAEVFMMVRPPRKAKGIDRDVLRAIESWRGLPIARRYFGHLDPAAVEDAIGKLARQASLVRYPPLVEQEGVMVAQTEHSIYVGEEQVEVLTASA